MVLEDAVATGFKEEQLAAARSVLAEERARAEARSAARERLCKAIAARAIEDLESSIEAARSAELKDEDGLQEALAVLSVEREKAELVRNVVAETEKREVAALTAAIECAEAAGLHDHDAVRAAKAALAEELEALERKRLEELAALERKRQEELEASELKRMEEEEAFERKRLEELEALERKRIEEEKALARKRLEEATKPPRSIYELEAAIAAAEAASLSPEELAAARLALASEQQMAAARKRLEDTIEMFRQVLHEGQTAGLGADELSRACARIAPEPPIGHCADPPLENEAEPQNLQASSPPPRPRSPRSGSRAQPKKRRKLRRVLRRRKKTTHEGACSPHRRVVCKSPSEPRAGLAKPSQPTVQPSATPPKPAEPAMSVVCEPLPDEPSVTLDHDGVLVVYKPPHWTCTTSAVSKSPIQSWLVRHYGDKYPFLMEKPPRQLGLQAGLVHRLDVETSGPVVIGARRDTYEQLVAQLEGKRWYKEYNALMHGALPPHRASGKLTWGLLPATKGWKGRRRRAPRTLVDEDAGLSAETHYQAIQILQRRVNGALRRYTLLRVQIVTGRTHQIRVHLAELGRAVGLPICGLVGDYMYLQPAVQKVEDDGFCRRTFLHERALEFMLPGGRPVRVECPLPADLREVLGRMQVDQSATVELQQFAHFLRLAPASLPEDLVPSVAIPTRTIEFRGNRERIEESEGCFAANRRSNVRSRSRSHSCNQIRSRSPSRWRPRSSSSEAERGSSCSLRRKGKAK